MQQNCFGVRTDGYMIPFQNREGDLRHLTGILFTWKKNLLNELYSAMSSTMKQCMLRYTKKIQGCGRRREMDTVIVSA